jgi:hypothetical protein
MGGITIPAKNIDTSKTKIKNVVYIVNVFQSEDAKETAEQKITRLIKNAVMEELNNPNNAIKLDVCGV